MRRIGSRTITQSLTARIQCKEHYQLHSGLEETRYLQQLSWYATSVADINQSEFNAQTVPISIKLCISHSQEGVDVQDWHQKHHTITNSKNSMQRTLPIAIMPWGTQVFAVTVLKWSFGSRDIKQSEFNEYTAPISIKLCISHSQKGADAQEQQQEYHTITNNKNSMQKIITITIKPWRSQVTSNCLDKQLW